MHLLPPPHRLEVLTVSVHLSKQASQATGASGTAHAEAASRYW